MKNAEQIVIEQIALKTGPTGGWLDSPKAVCAAIVEALSKAFAADEGREPLESLRSNGWMVAVHNDYMQAGEMFTFWLLTKGDRCIKGEAKTDTEALRICLSLAERGTPQPAKKTTAERKPK